MAWALGDTVEVGGRSGVVEAVEADGTVHVWYGAVRPVDQAHLCEVVPPTPGGTLDKLARIAAIDARTDALIEQGFRFPPGQGAVYSLSASAQQQLIGAYAGRLSPYFSYPVHWGARDGSSIALASADELEMFYLVAVGTVRSHLDSGQALKERVVAAQTAVDLMTVEDDR